MLHKLQILLIILTVSSYGMAQTTTGGVAGIIRSAEKKPMQGVNIKLLHEFSGASYFAKTDRNGWFEIENVLPGGPYLLEASSAGYASKSRKGLMIRLGEPQQVDLTLIEKEIHLGNITVATSRRNATGAVTFLDAERIASIPSVGHNLHDYLKYVPQAKQVAGNEGAISIAGQNNRFNSFYIDGAVSNDVFGLAASGTNGGQSGISPLPADALEQLEVTISPFDVASGNFTGAGINAVTRSGTNKRESSVYYYFSNSMLAGKTPGTDKEEAQKPDGFMRRTTGFRMQGPFTRNRSFYFINIDLQHAELPQLFNFDQYIGDTRNAGLLSILSTTLKGTYHYNPGTYLNNPSVRNAVRTVARMDWSAGTMHKFMFSYRHTDAGRENTNMSSSDLIQFSNNGYHLQNSIRSASFEIKSKDRNTGNRLMLTFTRVTDERKPLGDPFPRVKISDGDGAIVFGTDGNSALNKLYQHNWTLFDKLSITQGKHTLGIGVDCEYNQIRNAFIQNAFGSYTFSSIANFLTNQHPSYYQLGYDATGNDSYNDQRASAKFSTARVSLFFSDKIRISGALQVTAGLRVDKFIFINRPGANPYLDDSVIPILNTYRNLEDFATGGRTTVPVSLSPRFGFHWTPWGEHLTLHGGAGFFTGRVPLAWPGNAYLHTGNAIAGYIAAPGQLNRIRFRPDPFAPWRPGELGASNNNTPIDLLASTLNLPTIIRSLVGVNWSHKGWFFSSSFLITKNLTEMRYTNANLVPPTAKAVGSDNRSVYTIQNDGRIPIKIDGSNPYSHVILLQNYDGKKGQAINYTFSALRKTAVLDIQAAYNYCSSFAVNDGTSSVSLSQWRFMETVNGRNDITRSRSDFSSGHRIFVLVSHQFALRKDITHTISIAYTGESGQPFSYVYGNAGMVRDDGTLGGNDLVYIPTTNELALMEFLPFTSSSGNLVNADQQKQALEKYIAETPVLNARRGGYAERNIGRTPFTNTLDLKIKLEWKLRWLRELYRVQLTCDLYNAGNFLHPAWGKRYLQVNDNFQLIRFMGYQSETDLRPRFQFDPNQLKSVTYIINNSFDPGYASRWVCQLGIRLIF